MPTVETYKDFTIYVESIREEDNDRWWWEYHVFRTKNPRQGSIEVGHMMALSSDVVFGYCREVCERILATDKLILWALVEVIEKERVEAATH